MCGYTLHSHIIPFAQIIHAINLVALICTLESPIWSPSQSNRMSIHHSAETSLKQVVCGLCLLCDMRMHDIGVPQYVRHTHAHVNKCGQIKWRHTMWCSFSASTEAAKLSAREPSCGCWKASRSSHRTSMHISQRYRNLHRKPRIVKRHERTTTMYYADKNSSPKWIHTDLARGAYIMNGPNTLSRRLACIQSMKECSSMQVKWR